MTLITEMVLQSSLFVLLLMVFRPLLKKTLSARTHFTLWLFPMIRLLVPVSVKSTLSLWKYMVSEGVLPIAVKTISSHTTATTIANQPLANTLLQQSQHTVVTEPLLTMAAADKFQWQTMLPTLGLCIWILGAAIAIGWMVIINYRFGRNIRGAKRLFTNGLPLPVCLSENLSSPCLSGVLRPCIVLNSASLKSESVLDMVLLHELTHWRRKDHVWTTMRNTLLCVWWWNPLVWVAASLSRRDCEAACDEAVIKGMNVHERQAYHLSASF